MARLVFGMNQSLDGYVDHMAFAPSATLFRHFIAEAEGEYRIYVHPVVVGHGKRYFAGPGRRSASWLMIGWATM